MRADRAPGHAGPVRALLGGMTSPATFSVLFGQRFLCARILLWIGLSLGSGQDVRDVRPQLLPRLAIGLG